MANQVIKLDELKHYGVKGMKWDQSKKKSESRRSPSGKIKGNRLTPEKGFTISREDIGPVTPYGRNIKKLSPKSQVEIDVMTANEYVDYLNTYQIERTDETEKIWNQKRKSEKVNHSDLNDIENSIKHWEIMGAQMEGDVVFTKKQADAIFLLIADVLEASDVDEEDALNSLEQSAIGTYLDTLSDDELAHFGVLGMKWGVRRASRQADQLERKTKRLENKFNRGGNVDRNTIRKTSQRFRKYSYRTTKRISKITKYLQRDAGGGMTLSNRFIKVKHKPEELARAKQYLADSVTLKERYNSIGARLDSLKLDSLM